MPGLEVYESEISRIRASVREPAQTDKEAKRLSLRAKSQARTDRWPNTLEAMRRKKDNWKQDREEQEEKRRQEIDAQELKLQREARLQQLRRANQLMYDQTDKMKTLRSKQLLSDILMDRKYQIEEKLVLKKEEELRESRWESMLRQQLIEADEKERISQAEIEKKHKQLARDQKQQLQEFKKRYIYQLQEEKIQGEQIALKAKRDAEEEEKQEEERRRKAKQANEETRQANEQLQLLRLQEKEKEVLEEEKRKKDEEIKMQILHKRDELQRIKVEKSQIRKQRMIDLATEHLLNLENRTEQRLENQKREVQEKEDNDLRERAERRERQRREIDHSRRLQLKERQERKIQEVEESKCMIKQWTEYNKQIEDTIFSEENERLELQKQISEEQKRQANARRERQMEERVTQLLMDKEAKLALKVEDERYHILATKALEEVERFGGETYPLRSALTTKSIDLLPAGGFRT